MGYSGRNIKAATASKRANRGSRKGEERERERERERKKENWEESKTTKRKHSWTLPALGPSFDSFIHHVHSLDKHCTRIMHIFPSSFYFVTDSRLVVLMSA